MEENMGNFANHYGSWALVTGSSAGIGEEFARQLAKAGLNLVLVARREKRLRKLAALLENEYGVQVRIAVVDLAADSFLPVIVSLTEDIEVGLVVNNAGFAVTGEFLDNQAARELDMLYVNCRAPLLLAKEFGMQMAERRQGGIIMVSSIAGFSAMPRWSHYAATKAYSLLLGEGLAYELQKFGVDVLTLCPGSTSTEFHQVAGVHSGKSMKPAAVVAAAIRNLGKKTTFIPGFHNLLIASTARFLPRRLNTGKGAFIVNHLCSR
jgi:short-subunit dehydrogenase